MRTPGLLLATLLPTPLLPTPLLPIGRAQAPPAAPQAPAVPTARETMEAGIVWLVAHQDEDGGFSASQFVRHDPKGDLCTGTGKPDQDFHVTAWATMALLAGSNGHRDSVAKAVDWIEARMGKDGFLGEPSAPNAVAAHAIACFASTEGTALGGGRPLTEPLRALARLQLADGTWPARPGETKGDASATHWACWAMISAREFHAIDFDFAPTIAFAQQQPAFLLPASEALLRTFAHHDRKQDARLDQLCRDLAAHLPQWPATPQAPGADFLAWQLGSAVLFQQGGEEWERWEAALEQALLPHQRTDGAHAGSWDPIDVRGRECGRVYATAVNVLALSFGHRRAVLMRAAPRPPAGGQGK